MTITTVVVSNRAKIAEHLGIAEEAVDTVSTKWIALIGEEELVGLVAGKSLSPYERRTAVFVPKALWRDKPTVKAMGDALDLLGLDVYKLTAAFPVAAEGALSLAMRLGFQREGINRRSWEGEDQYYLGKDGGKQNAAAA